MPYFYVYQWVDKDNLIINVHEKIDYPNFPPRPEFFRNIKDSFVFKIEVGSEKRT